MSTDSKRTMTGRVFDVATIFQQATTYPVIRVWCGLHQIDPIVQDKYLKLCDDTFVSMLTELVSYLRHQLYLIVEVKTTCPKCMNTR